ncbi:MAG: glycerophosphodiester phosphodiesterase [Planctomycetes bacterium]|nr:glycerophosphodiester phosphodiesterase [Planctomycetota bacterium]
MPRRPLEIRLDQLAANRPIVTAHRGDPVAFPENTEAAFRAAASLGAEIIEFDIRETRDAAFVCIHDATFDRTTDSAAKFGRAAVRVDESSLADARTLDAGAGEPVPELRSAIASMHPAIPMIERKGGSARELVELLRSHDLVDDVFVQSFDWEWVAEVRKLAPELAIGLLGGDDDHPRLLAEDLETLTALDAAFVHWQVDRVDQELVDAVHARGAKVCVFTANTDDEFERLTALGVDAITTNHPARLIEFRSARAGEQPRSG